MQGLYIHIPFCVSKCVYCDFASFAGKEAMRLILEGQTGFMAGYKLEGEELLSNPIDLDVVAGQTRFPSKEDIVDLKNRITLEPFIVL